MGAVNWIGLGTLYMREVRRFMKVYTQTLVAPVVTIASIGTQISEAFAGLDRIREILGTPTEMDEDESREPVDQLTGDIELEDV